MTISIKSFSNKNKTEISGRRTEPLAYVRTVHLNQTDGNFVAVKPLDNAVIVYGQSPNLSNSWFGDNKVIADLYGFGSFNFPLDAKFDYVRRKIWVCDTGNNRVLQIDYNKFLVDFEITNIKYPSALAINQVNGDIFVRGFSNATTGSIYWANKSGILIDVISFDDTFPNDSFTLSKIGQTSESLPMPSTMDFDHVRGRLWWTANDKVYMADVNTMEISSFNLSAYGLQEVYPVEVEYATGNVLIGCYPSGSKITGDKRFSTIVYMFKDNNYPIEIMDIADSVGSDVVDPSSQPTIETGQLTAWPSKLKFDGFSLGGMNGTWELGGNYRGQVFSYINPNNTIDLSQNRKDGTYSVGSYILQPSGTYVWQFIFYVIFDYPQIYKKWIYRKESKTAKPTGRYVLESYYSADSYPNEFPDDFGDVTIG